MNQPFLLYGATGYTGKLIARRAKSLGMRAILAGRSAEKVAAVAAPLGFPKHTLSLDDNAALDALLEKVPVVLHAAGPFSETASPMVAACLRTKTHYVDITGEIQVFEGCAHRSQDAEDAGIMLLPGAGFDVVPSDCLAKHVSERVPGGHHLTLAMSGMSKASRGTAKTAAQYIGLGTYVRRGGKIHQLTDVLSQEFDFGDGPQKSVAVSWGDVSTAYHSTNIPDIDVFFQASGELERAMRIGGLTGRILRSKFGQRVVRRQINRRPEGPTDDMRETTRHVILAQVTDGFRNSLTARLTTPEAYSLTAETSLAIVQRILDGDWKPGFQTPSNLYGADFILNFDGVTREDLKGEAA